MTGAVAEEGGRMHAIGLPAQGWRRHSKGAWSTRGRSVVCEAGTIIGKTGKCAGGRQTGA